MTSTTLARPVLAATAPGLEPSRPRRLPSRDQLGLLSLIATGRTLPVIADQLHVSDRTVRRRLRAICDDLDVSTPIEAVVWAARRRLI